VFGATAALDRAEALDALRQRHPSAHLVGCSTAGEITGTRVHDDSIVATAIAFVAVNVIVAGPPQSKVTVPLPVACL